MKLTITEILDKIEKASTKQEKIALFKQFETNCMRGLMRINFDTTVSMNLPDTDPPYKKITDKPLGMDHSLLEIEYRKFYVWLDKNVQLSQAKKEHLFIQLLENLHYTEAEVLLLVKNQNLRFRYPSITEDLIREIWPNLMPPKQNLTDQFKNVTNTVNAPFSQVVGEVKDVPTTITTTEIKRKPGRPKKVK